MAKSLIKMLKQDESIGILSVTTGQLNVARIPVLDAPDWVVPEALILAIEPYHERIWNYLWQKQEVPVYHLIPNDEIPESIVVLESVTDVHRLALQIQGHVTYDSVRIADLRDIDEEAYHERLKLEYPVFFNTIMGHHSRDQTDETVVHVNEQHYVFQPVLLKDELCVVPDLDKLSHIMVDLDS